MKTSRVTFANIVDVCNEVEIDVDEALDQLEKITTWGDSAHSLIGMDHFIEHVKLTQEQKDKLIPYREIFVDLEG